MNRHTSKFLKEKYLVCSGISFPTPYQLLQQHHPADHNDAVVEAESPPHSYCKTLQQRNSFIMCVDDCTQYHEKTATTLRAIIKKKNTERIKMQEFKKIFQHNNFPMHIRTCITGGIIIKNKEPGILIEKKLYFL